MLRANLVGRIDWVGDLKVEERNGQQFKSILLRISTRRDYPSLVKRNGKEERVYQYDSYFCRALGSIAEVISNHATAKDQDGKLIRRLVEVAGRMECYKAKKSETKVHQFDVDGELVEAEIEHVYEVDEYQLTIDTLNFLDYVEQTATPAKTVTPVKKVKRVATVKKAEEAVKAEVESATVEVVSEPQTAKVEAVDLDLSDNLLDDEDYPY